MELVDQEDQEELADQEELVVLVDRADQEDLAVAVVAAVQERILTVRVRITTPSPAAGVELVFLVERVVFEPANLSVTMDRLAQLMQEELEALRTLVHFELAATEEI